MNTIQSPAERETLRLALGYRALGWSVVPVTPRSKVPAVTWAPYQTRLATESELEGWFSVGGYGVGLVQGAISHTLVVDFDGEEGMATRARWEREHGPLPHTVEALTPGGGCHVVLRHPGHHVPTRKGVAPGVDVRGDGGFIVACPSVHENTRRYEWDVDHHPDETEVAECPGWLLEILCANAPEQGPAFNGWAGMVDPNRPNGANGVGSLGLREAPLADGREEYMRDTVLAVLADLCRSWGRTPGLDELVAEVWPQYSARVDFSRPGRGPDEVREKCRRALARLARGLLPGLTAPEAGASEAQPGVKLEEPVGESEVLLPATPFMAGDITGLPPREWVYGHFIIKRFVSVLGAPGGAGKTAYAMGIALAVALGRDLLGEPVRRAGPVWVFNLEDPRDELMRRFAAAIKHHGINPVDLEGQLYVDSGRDQPLIVARADGKGNTFQMPVVKALVAELLRRGIVMLVVDPFVKSHRLEENRNEHIDFAATLWAEVAEQAGCAILLLHHFRKGGVSGAAESFRGASALIDAARAAVTLGTMSDEEADKLGIDAASQRLLIRADNAKLNLAPPPDRTTWLRLVPVDLENGSALGSIPSDSVQAIERWEPPSAWDDMPLSMVVRILDYLHAGPGDGEQYTLAKGGPTGGRWAGAVVVDVTRKTDGQAAAILKRWTLSGLLNPTDYESPKQRKPRKGLAVDLVKLSEMRRDSGVF